jgi:hypothetical protein
MPAFAGMTGFWTFYETVNLGCFNFGKIICGAEGLDEIGFVHGVPFFGIAVGWINNISINLQQCDRICQTHVVICVQTLNRRRH